MLRRIALGGGAAALFLGCLFPSFDDLKNQGGAPSEEPTDDDDATNDSGETPSSSSGGTSGGTSTSSSGTVADTGADTATPPKKTIACGNSTCDADTQVCCDEGFGNTPCKPKGSDCTLWRFACDDFTDCPSGQRCCRPDGQLEVLCAADCNGGSVICQPAQGCPSGAGTCKDELSGPPDVSVRVCKP